MATNSGAIASYENCGFLKEGQLRRHVLKSGIFEDMLVMGLYNE